MYRNIEDQQMENVLKRSKKKEAYTTIASNVVSQMKQAYPEMMAEFLSIQREQYELFAMKQQSYGPNNISVGTQLKTEADVKLSLTGLFFRMNDKIERIKTMIMNDVENKDEPLEDSFLDLSVYGIIAEIVRRGSWGK